MLAVAIPFGAVIGDALLEFRPPAPSTMPWVILRGSETKYPLACVCCLQAPTTTVTIDKVKTIHLGVARIRKTFRAEVPYCASCREHASDHESAQPGQVLLGGIGVVILVSGLEYCAGSCAVKVLPPLSPAPGGGSNPMSFAILAFFALLPWALALVFVVRGLSRRPVEVAMPPHASKVKAARVHDFNAEHHTLVFDNAEYWRRFVEANATQVVSKG